MREASDKPSVQLFVCTNVRASGDPLQSGCGAHGPGVYDALKRRVAEQGRMREVWVTRTLCAGRCARDGCAVSAEPVHRAWVEVTERDVDAVLRDVLESTRTR